MVIYVTKHHEDIMKKENSGCANGLLPEMHKKAAL
jgi:hypothetical protein